MSELLVIHADYKSPLLQHKYHLKYHHQLNPSQGMASRDLKLADYVVLEWLLI